MKKEILTKIQQLGGNISQVKGQSFIDDLLSITFNTVLYPKPENTPWQTAQDTEPIFGLNEFFEQNQELINQDKPAFYNKVIEKYFQLTDEGYCQMFWTAKLFTPFKKGTEDYEEWNDIFTDEDEVDLKEIITLTKNKKPNFIQLFYSYGFPDAYFICLDDPNPNNPTLFGTDHEVFFSEVTNEGSLEYFLNKFFTKEEVIKNIKKRIE